MTTRGIRRKKSYLVDAKIAVCGQKSVGKSGKGFYSHRSFLFICAKKNMYAHDEKKSIFVMNMKKKCVHLEPFFSLSCSSRKKCKMYTEKSLLHLRFPYAYARIAEKICENFSTTKNLLLIRHTKKLVHG